MKNQTDEQRVHGALMDRLESMLKEAKQRVAEIEDDYKTRLEELATLPPGKVTPWMKSCVESSRIQILSDRQVVDILKNQIEGLLK